MAKFDIIISGDSSEVAQSIVGENVSKGDILYLHTDSKWYKASAANKLTSTTELGIASIDALTGDEINIISFGYFNYTPGSLLAGIKYYLSVVPGEITTTSYVNTSNIIRYVGTAYSTEILAFNPDQTYISDNGAKVNDVPIKSQFIPHTHPEADITDLDKFTQQEIINNYVPYSGANSPIDLNTQPITTEGLGTFKNGVSLEDSDITGVKILQFEPDHNVTWNTKYHTMEVDHGDGATGKVTTDTLFDIHNATGELLKQGFVVYPDGTSTNGVSNVQLAIANSHETLETQLGVVAADILDGDDGHVIVRGVLDPIDTSTAVGEGPVWLSPTVPGSYVQVRPVFPDYEVLIGNIDKYAVDGVFTVDTYFNLQNTLTNFWNGTIRESFYFDVVDDGAGGLKGQLKPANGHPNLTGLLSDGFYTIVPSEASLTAGTDTTPQMNFVYFLRSTKSLVVSLTGFPIEEHIKIGTYYLRTAATTLADGPLKAHPWNDHIEDTHTYQGHLAHITERLRQEGAQWSSGVETSVNEVSNSEVYLNTTGGVIYQLHKQSFPAFDTQAGQYFHLWNSFDNPFEKFSNLYDIDADSLGNSLNNSSFSIVLFGSVNSGSSVSNNSQLFIGTPKGTYSKNNPDEAVSDAFNYSNYTIPMEFRGTGFLIARITCVRQANGDLTIYDIEDLTDASTRGAGGAGGGGVTSFLGLTDTPSTYAGSENYTLKVGTGGAGVDFINVIESQTKTPITSEFLNSYDASTGLFTSTQPSTTDISGIENYVDLTSPQDISGLKNFTNGLDFGLQIKTKGLTTFMELDETSIYFEDPKGKAELWNEGLSFTDGTTQYPGIYNWDATGTHMTSLRFGYEPSGVNQMWLPLASGTVALEEWVIAQDYQPNLPNSANIAYTDIANVFTESQTVQGDLDVTGNGDFVGPVTAPSIKLTTGAGLGKVLTSDASGNATWEVPVDGSLYVPYTGAVSTVDLNNKTLQNVNTLSLINGGTIKNAGTSGFQLRPNGVLTLTTVNQNNNYIRITGANNPRDGQEEGLWVAVVGKTFAYPFNASTPQDFTNFQSKTMTFNSVVNMTDYLGDSFHTSIYINPTYNDTGITHYAIRSERGKMRFGGYGVNTYTGTATKNLAVDINGNVIETDILAGGGDFVPYIGANDDVTLGANGLYSTTIVSVSSGGNTSQMTPGVVQASGASGTSQLRQNAIEFISGINAITLAPPSSFSSSHVIRLPEKGGTVALTSDIQSAPYEERGTANLSGVTNITIPFGGHQKHMMATVEVYCYAVSNGNKDRYASRIYNAIVNPYLTGQITTRTDLMSDMVGIDIYSPTITIQFTDHASYVNPYIWITGLATDNVYTYAYKVTYNEYDPL